MREKTETFREIQEQLHSILSNIKEPVFIISEDHEILFGNQLAYEKFGENIIGKKCYDAISCKTSDENLSRFISMVTHELRTPITVLVQSISNFNKYEDKMSKEMKITLNETISRNITLLSELVEDLLIVSRIDEKKINLVWKEYQPSQLIREILDLMDPRRSIKEIKIDVDINEDLWLMGDSKRISQIFRILIDNAIKYSHEKSRIQIRAIDQYQGKFNSRMLDGVLFQFVDFGIGIPEEDIPRLFQRFFRARNAAKTSGTGLGLAIAKELTALHDGEIFVESEHEKGATFSVFLPKLKTPPIIC